MKIGIVSPEFPPEMGGVQTYAFEYAQEVARRGHEVTVFTTPHAAGEVPNPGLRIEPLLRLRRRLDRHILQDRHMDVWHVMNAAYAWLALETSPVFVTVHGNDFLAPYLPVAHLDLRARLRLPFGSQADRWLGDRLTWHLVRRSLPQAAHIFTNSQYTRQIFLRTHPECRGKTSAAMVGVAEEYFSSTRPSRTAEPARLITICRLAEEHKNVHLVLQALGKLRATFDFRYTVIGDGHLRLSLEKLTDELGLRDRVTFTGFLEPAALRRHLLASDLFILTTSATPTAYEGFGLVYLEAAACGTPVLAARIGGATEAVAEGSSGIFVDEVTEEAIAQRLRGFLAGETTFAAADCVAFARTFAWGRVAEHCLGAYAAAGVAR